MRTLTIILAKKHSRRLPGKNRKRLEGLPLYGHAIRHAQQSGVCGTIAVATDCPEIAKGASDLGAVVPFLRNEIDTDDETSAGEAAYRFLVQYEQYCEATFDYVCLLLSTSPLRSPEDIQNSYNTLLENPKMDAVSTFSEVHGHPYWTFNIQRQNAKPFFPNQCHLDRHQLEPDEQHAYLMNGSVYWANAPFFKSVQGDQYKGQIGAVITPAERSVDVDTPFDFALCQFLLSKSSESI